MQADRALALELSHHYLFSALSEAQQERLLATAVSRQLSPGERLFTHGERAGQFFLVRRGCVKLYRLSPEGDEKIMRLIRPSQTFAESILFMDAPQYPVHGEGVEAAELIAFDRETFLAILRESFPTCLAVMAQMTRRIQAHWDEIETLALQNSRYRVVHYLLGLLPQTAQGRVTVTLPARKMVIAAHVAVTPETLSRTLRGLSDEGLIEGAGEEVTIVDVERLRRHMR
jgi:CRP-like cAMP-binding protein